MTTTQKIVSAIAALWLVALSVAALNGGSQNLGGSSFYEAYPVQYGGGLYVGNSSQLAIDQNGNATTTGRISASGALRGSFGIWSGSVYSTSTGASLKLTDTDMNPYSMISEALSVGSVTITLPASSTLSTWISSTAGSERSIMIENASTTAGITITLASGAGTFLQKATSTAAIIYPNRAANLRCIRLASTDISCMAYGI